MSDFNSGIELAISKHAIPSRCIFAKFTVGDADGTGTNGDSKDKKDEINW